MKRVNIGLLHRHVFFWGGGPLYWIPEQPGKRSSDKNTVSKGVRRFDAEQLATHSKLLQHIHNIWKLNILFNLLISFQEGLKMLLLSILFSQGNMLTCLCTNFGKKKKNSNGYNKVWCVGALWPPSKMQCWQPRSGGPEQHSVIPKTSLIPQMCHYTHTYRILALLYLYEDHPLE